jgi:Na+/H+ antiporter
MVGLLVAVAILALLARRLSIPYPIVLVIGGLLLAFVPGLPRPRLNPEMVFFLFLPPLLFPAALFSSWRDFHANLRHILMLAVGLVLFTTITVGFLASHLFPGLPLAAGMLLGAIISPPDAIAATSIAQRLPIPRRLLTIIEGESLINDATALVAYRFAIAALLVGTFSIPRAVGVFFAVAIGGIAIGLLIAVVIAALQQRLDNPPVQTTLSLLTPFISYIAAEKIHVSGVLAVVTTGFYLGWRAPEIVSARLRLQAGPVWEMVEFLLNGVVFILIGLQLPEILQGLQSYSNAQLLLYAVLINLAVIFVRILWVFPAAYLSRLLFCRVYERDCYPKWQHIALLAWTGMRGVVSLAAALAIPLTAQNAAPFPGRNLILFLTFSVILGTLVLQGLTLAPIIRWLKIEDDGEFEKEELNARLKANEAALARLNELSTTAPLDSDAVQRLRTEYEDRLRQVHASDAAGSVSPLFSSDYQRLAYEALQVERKIIIQLRNSRVIGDDVLRRIQRDIDLAEARLRFPAMSS